MVTMVKENNDSIEIENEMLMLGVYALVVRGIGNDTLMGTNVKYYLQLSGLEKLLKKFIKDLDILFNFVYKEDIAGFLKGMKEKFKINFDMLQEDIVNNILGMKSIDSDEVMIQYMIITKTLEEIREHVYKNFKKTNLKQIDDTKINSLTGKALEDYSLLYNLIFIEYLAKTYDDKKMEAKVKDIIIQKTENIIKNLK